MTCGSYQDYSGFDGRAQAGRTRNSVATIVAGTVAQKAYGDASINLMAKKRFWADAAIVGSSSYHNTHAAMDLTFTRNTYRAQRDAEGYSHGTVDKSEFNWKVDQTSQTHYGIQRALLKFDTSLDLEVKDGHISGSYNKSIAPDWKISGTYTEEGDVKILIDVPFSLADVVLEGKITPR